MKLKKSRHTSFNFVFCSSTDGGLLRIRTQRPHGGSRRTTVKRKSSKGSKTGKRKDRQEGELSAAERLRENIRKFRTEERLLAVDPSSIGDECEGLIQGNSLEESAVPQSPSLEMNTELKVTELSSAERWLKLEIEVCGNEVCSSGEFLFTTFASLAYTLQFLI